MRLLHIGTDRDYERDLKLVLQDAAFTCEHQRTADRGLVFAQTYPYDCIILDTDLPQVNFDVHIRQLARGHQALIVYGASEEVARKAQALNAGADDYMMRPLDGEELLARVHAIVRRYHGFAVSTIFAGDLSVDLLARQVFKNGYPVKLSPTKYEVVELLALNLGQCVSRNQVFDAIYHGANVPEMKILDVMMCLIRKKLGGNYIETIWGRGFRMIDPEAQ